MIVGVATVTMVRSTRIMKKPSTSAKSAGHGLTSVCVEVGAVWVTGLVNTSPLTMFP
jgi:hypothetical protein